MSDRIDLHAHTTHSDGTDAPEALVALARAAELSALAVTDHDTLAGIAPARAAAEGLGIEIVPGVELSVDHDGGELHLLGYFVDPSDARLLATLDATRATRGPRNDAILAKLAALGVHVTPEDVALEAGIAGAPGKSVGRPHVAAALVRRGYVGSIQEAFDLYLADGRPAHVPKAKLTVTEALGAVRGAGGVAVLAHPFTLPEAERRGILETLARQGLEGVEVEYPRHDAPLRATLLGWARELDLVPTGGSDYHGGNKPDIALGHGIGGNIHVRREALEALRERSRR